MKSKKFNRVALAILGFVVSCVLAIGASYNAVVKVFGGIALGPLLFLFVGLAVAFTAFIAVQLWKPEPAA